MLGWDEADPIERASNRSERNCTSILQRELAVDAFRTKPMHDAPVVRKRICTHELDRHQTAALEVTIGPKRRQIAGMAEDEPHFAASGIRPDPSAQAAKAHASSQARSAIAGLFDILVVLGRLSIDSLFF
jgi:hypothetical protein